MHSDNILERLREIFVPDDVKKIVEFLERNFSPNGELVIAGLFICAYEAGKHPVEVIPACEKEWLNNWQYQHPEARADPDCRADPIAARNRMSLNNIYRELDVSNPLSEGTKLRPEPMVVKTGNSTYHFGKIEEDGYRTATRDEEPLKFNRCKILFLAEGKEMRLETELGQSSGDNWVTSPVSAINPA